jgi:hypothetical protein
VCRYAEDITFTPLKQTKSFNARELMEHYKVGGCTAVKFS